jgi:hypothetical protein
MHVHKLPPVRMHTFALTLVVRRSSISTTLGKSGGVQFAYFKRPGCPCFVVGLVYTLQGYTTKPGTQPLITATKLHLAKPGLWFSKRGLIKVKFSKSVSKT